MGARLRSWWQQIKTHPVATVLITVVITLVVLVMLGGYLFHWGWTGFNGNNKSGKTLWDWMQLLLVPVVLAVAGFWFNHRERKAAELRAEAEREIEQQRAKADREISFDNQHEAALQAYIDNMSELLLHEHLRESTEDEEVRKLARIRTLSVLRRCDAERKGNVLLFLHESNLIDKDNRIIDLYGADLSEADLSGADLSNTNLSNTNLSRADLFGANLSGADLNGATLYKSLLSATLSHADLYEAILIEANLSYADLSHADLYEANLSGADLSHANLSGARGTAPEQLKQAKSLKGATMPDGSIHP